MMRIPLAHIFVSLTLRVALHSSSIVPMIPVDTMASGVQSSASGLTQAEERIQWPRGIHESNERLRYSKLLSKNYDENIKKGFFENQAWSSGAQKEQTPSEHFLDHKGKEGFLNPNLRQYLMKIYGFEGKLMMTIIGGRCLWGSFWWLKAKLFDSNPVNNVEAQIHNDEIPHV